MIDFPSKILRITWRNKVIATGIGDRKKNDFTMTRFFKPIILLQRIFLFWVKKKGKVVYEKPKFDDVIFALSCANGDMHALTKLQKSKSENKQKIGVLLEEYAENLSKDELKRIIAWIRFDVLQIRLLNRMNYSLNIPSQAKKIALQENPEQGRDFLKKIGSNHLVRDRALSVSLKKPWRGRQKWHSMSPSDTLAHAVSGKTVKMR